MPQRKTLKVDSRAVGAGIVCCIQLDAGSKQFDAVKTGSTWLVAIQQLKSCQIYEVGKETRLRWTLLQPLDPTIRGKGSDYLFCKISPTGARVVACRDNHTITVWDNQIDGSVLHILKGHQSLIRDAIFITDSLLASCSIDGTVRFWDVVQGVGISQIALDCAIISLAWFTALDPSFGRLVCGGIDGFLYVWEIPIHCTAAEGSREYYSCVFETHFLGQFYTETTNGTICRMSSNGRTLVSYGTEGRVLVWDTIGMRDDYGTNIQQQALEVMNETKVDEEYAYIAVPEESFLVADGGASALEECEKAFRETLLEYTKLEKKPRTKKESIVEQRHLYNEQRKRANGNIKYTGTIEKVSYLQNHIQCEDIAFTRNFKDINSVEEDGLMFSSGQDNTLRVWCIETRKMLFQMRTPERVTQLHIFAKLPQHFISRHVIFCFCNSNIIAIELHGLSQLQVLAEYAQSHGETSCSTFWNFSQRKNLLQQTLELLGLGSSNGERGHLKHLHNKGLRLVKSILDDHTAGKDLIHGSDPLDFIQILVSMTGSLANRVCDLIANNKVTADKLCRCLVACPFKFKQVLAVLGKPVKVFEQISKCSLDAACMYIEAEGEITHILLKHGIVQLAETNRNRYGGDPDLGCFILPGGGQFYYVYARREAGSVPSRGYSAQSGVAEEFAVLAQPLMKTLSNREAASSTNGHVARAAKVEKQARLHQGQEEGLSVTMREVPADRKPQSTGKLASLAKQSRQRKQMRQTNLEVCTTLEGSEDAPYEIKTLHKDLNPSPIIDVAKNTGMDYFKFKSLGHVDAAPQLRKARPEPIHKRNAFHSANSTQTIAIGGQRAASPPPPQDNAACNLSPRQLRLRNIC